MIAEEITQNPINVDVTVAIIGLIGLIIGGGIAWAKDRQLTAVRNQKDLEIAEITSNKNLEIAEITSNKNLEIAETTNAKDLKINEMKVSQDLQIEYDKDLRSQRLIYYIKLWECMSQLPKYPEPIALTYHDVRNLAEGFRDWYFGGGGLFMSAETREKYFDMQDGLKILLQKQKGTWDSKKAGLGEPNLGEHLGKYLERPEDWKPPEELKSIATREYGEHQDKDPADEEIVGNLRKLGSALRTSMTEDVQTRVQSQLADA